MTRRVRLISGAHPARRRRLAGARQAITIIEILAIVIIVAISLAIAFPMFATRCGGSPKTAQLSNVKQLATSRMMRAQDSVWVYGRGMHFAYADGHAKFIMLAQMDWHTPARSPFAAYDEHGVPSKYWSTGCHTWLFRPDHQMEEQP